MFTWEKEVKIAIVMEEIRMEDVRNSEETHYTENLIILRNFQYLHKFFMVYLASSMSDSVTFERCF